MPEMSPLQDALAVEIRDAISLLMNPPLMSVCICEKPVLGHLDKLFWSKCRTCGQALSLERACALGSCEHISATMSLGVKV